MKDPTDPMAIAYCIAACRLQDVPRIGQAKWCLEGGAMVCRDAKGTILAMCPKDDYDAIAAELAQR